MNKSYGAIIICLISIVIGACERDGGGSAISGDIVCRALIEERFNRIGDILGKTWDVLGILRSITIQPAYRARFLESVVDDAIVVLDEVAQLTAYCNVCSGHCHHFLTAFEDIGDRFAGVAEAFRAVCVPEYGCEERIFGEIIRRAAQHFDSCWEAALKVDPAAKTDLRITSNVMAT